MLALPVSVAAYCCFVFFLICFHFGGTYQCLLRPSLPRAIQLYCVCLCYFVLWFADNKYELIWYRVDWSWLFAVCSVHVPSWAVPGVITGSRLPARCCRCGRGRRLVAMETAVHAHITGVLGAEVSSQSSTVDHHSSTLPASSSSTAAAAATARLVSNISVHSPVRSRRRLPWRCDNRLNLLHVDYTRWSRKNAESLIHRHFAIVCSRIMRFSPCMLRN